MAAHYPDLLPVERKRGSAIVAAILASSQVALGIQLWGWLTKGPAGDDFWRADPLISQVLSLARLQQMQRHWIPPETITDSFQRVVSPDVVIYWATWSQIQLTEKSYFKHKLTVWHPISIQLCCQGECPEVEPLTFSKGQFFPWQHAGLRAALSKDLGATSAVCNISTG